MFASNNLMKMKKFKYTILASVAALSLVGCNEEEFLTENPKTIYTKENAFNKVTQADATLVTAYSLFVELNTYSFGLFMGNPTSSFLHGEGSDVLGGCRGPVEAGSSFNNYWALSTDNSNFSGLWENMYKLASYANLALDGLEVLEATPEEELYIEAQAKFFRGWAYLRLAECFGAVPLVDKFTETLRFDYNRTTREDSYNFAIEDLKFAADNLPQYPKADGRVAKGAAQHFLSEAYLGLAIEKGNDAQTLNLAVKAADEVIAAHPLMTHRFGSRSEAGAQPAGVPDNGAPRYRPDGNTYFDMFQIGNYAYSAGNTESLMIFDAPYYDQVAINGGYLPVTGFTFGAIYRDQSWSDKYLAEHPEGMATGPWKGEIDNNKFPGGNMGCHVGGGSWGILMTTDYVDEHVWRNELAADDRNAEINLWTPVVMAENSPYSGQVATPDMITEPSAFARVSRKISSDDVWGWDLNHSFNMGTLFGTQYGRDWYIARSAETYLLRAEAKMLLGDAQGAADDINAVRARANAAKMYSAGEIDYPVIFEERTRELSLEELRWPTLCRIGGEAMAKQLEGYSQWAFDEPVFAGKDFPAWRLFPIPLSVKNLNTDVDLGQNPGWN